MGNSPVVALFLTLFLVLLTNSADAFNVTKILGKYPDFTSFNNYLTQAGVASTINSIKTVTVLAVSNGNLNELSSLSSDALKRMMSVHVVLDYYDSSKLEAIPPNRTIKLTTLYQRTGQAQNGVGFLAMTRQKKNDGGGVAFKSYAAGSNQNSMFVKSIDSEPYDISILQIGNLINIPENATATTTPPPSQSHDGPVASPPSTDDDSTTPPTASPPKPSKAPSSSPTSDVAPEAASPADADAPADSAADTSPSSSAVSVITWGVHVQAILVTLITWAWFLFTMF